MRSPEKDKEIKGFILLIIAIVSIVALAGVGALDSMNPGVNAFIVISYVLSTLFLVVSGIVIIVGTVDDDVKWNFLFDKKVKPDKE